MAPVVRSATSPTAVPIAEVVRLSSDQSGDGKVLVAAALDRDTRSEHVDEQQGEEDGLDGHVGELQRLAGDVHQVAAGEHDHVVHLAETTTVGRRRRDRARRTVAGALMPAPPSSSGSSSSAVRRVGGSRGRSGRRRRRRATGAAPRRRRQPRRRHREPGRRVVARPDVLRTAAWKRRPSWLTWIGPVDVGLEGGPGAGMRRRQGDGEPGAAGRGLQLRPTFPRRSPCRGR